MDALILPLGPIDDETIDTQLARAIAGGLVACNRLSGPFRVSFFKPGRIPAGWSVISVAQPNGAAA